MHYDVTFSSILLKTSIFLLLIRDYQHTKFGLIPGQEKQSYGGGAGAETPSQQMSISGDQRSNYFLSCKI